MWGVEKACVIGQSKVESIIWLLIMHFSGLLKFCLNEIVAFRNEFPSVTLKMDGATVDSNIHTQ